jgi:hypothetical protein
MLSSNNFLTFTQNLQLPKISIFFALFAITTACEDPATDIGAELLASNDLISTNFTDTLSVKTATVLIDSVVTSATDKLLVGQYQDPVFGNITAKTFFQIANVDSIRANANSVLDSVVLNLGYKYYLGDTLKPQSITVHRVLEKIGQNTGSLTKRLLESLDSKNTYFNTDKLSYDPVPLGASGTFKARPIIQKRPTDNLLDSMRTLKIKLNESFGNELLSLAGKTAGSGLVNFKEYFKGMALVPGNNENAAILGFEPTNTPSTRRILPSFVGLYYHTKDKKDTLRTFFLVSFTSNEAFNNRFNNIEFNRANTALSKLTRPNDILEPVGPSQEVYVQSSSGNSTKIEFPSLKNLAKNGNIAINKVELLVKPTNLIEGTFPTIGLNLILPNTQNNKKPLRTPTGELSALPAESTATAQLALYNTTKQQYAFNITSYVQQILLGNIENNGLFLVSAPDNRVNRLILNKNSIKLRVYYSKLGK